MDWGYYNIKKTSNWVDVTREPLALAKIKLSQAVLCRCRPDNCGAGSDSGLPKRVGVGVFLKRQAELIAKRV